MEKQQYVKIFIEKIVVETFEIFTEFDFALTISTFLIGVAYGVEIGLPAGTIINMFSLLKPWTRPNVAVTYGTVRIIKIYRCK